MARRWTVALLLLLAAVSVPAAYKIYLVNGKVITADDKPVMRDGIAYFQKSGLELYLPVDQIDLLKTEKGGSSSGPESVSTEATAPKTPVRKIDEDKLDEISRRSRLANEGELQQPIYDETPEGGEGEGGTTAAPAPKPGAAANADRKAVQDQLNDLLNQRNNISKSMVSLQQQERGLRERYDTSTNQDERTGLQGQIDSVRSQLDGARSQLSNLATQIQATQVQLQSMPVVVEQ